MEMPERKMKQYQSKIDELSGHLMAQELALGLRKRQRTKEAKSVFTKAISWLVTEALAANIGNSTGSFSVSRNKNHYTKENPDRTGLVPWGLSFETAISDPKTNTGALESLLDGGFLRETRRGNYNRGGDLSKSKVTQYAATEKLLEYCKDVQDQSLFIPKPDTETIILKAPVPNESDQVEKALREYPDTPSSNQMREYLKLINQNMLSHWYDLYVADDTYVLMQQAERPALHQSPEHHPKNQWQTEDREATCGSNWHSSNTGVLPAPQKHRPLAPAHRSYVSRRQTKNFSSDPSFPP